MLALDHIVLVAATLDEGAAYIKEKLGVDVPEGGEHLAMGTHNRVMGLGNDAYLEIIAIAPHLDAPDRPRWFGMDDVPDEPVLRTWVARTNDIYSLAAESTVQMGMIVPMSRGELEWEIAIRDDGSMPLDGLFPTLIEWPEGEHPSQNMANLGCTLKRLRVHTPTPHGNPHAPSFRRSRPIGAGHSFGRRRLLERPNHDAQRVGHAHLTVDFQQMVAEPRLVRFVIGFRDHVVGRERR